MIGLGPEFLPFVDFTQPSTFSAVGQRVIVDLQHQK